MEILGSIQGACAAEGRSEKIQRRLRDFILKSGESSQWQLERVSYSVIFGRSIFDGKVDAQIELRLGSNQAWIARANGEEAWSAFCRALASFRQLDDEIELRRKIFPRPEDGSSPSVEASAHNRSLHKRLERWMRLQQFVYGLSNEYAYSVRLRDLSRVGSEVNVLVSVGWQTWFGCGRGRDQQLSLAMALLEASEALSATGTNAFIQFVRRRFSRWLEVLRVKSSRAGVGSEESESEERLAG